MLEQGPRRVMSRPTYHGEREHEPSYTHSKNDDSFSNIGFGDVSISLILGDGSSNNDHHVRRRHVYAEDEVNNSNDNGNDSMDLEMLVPPPLALEDEGEDSAEMVPPLVLEDRAMRVSNSSHRAIAYGGNLPDDDNESDIDSDGEFASDVPSSFTTSTKMRISKNSASKKQSPKKSNSSMNHKEVPALLGMKECSTSSAIKISSSSPSLTSSRSPSTQTVRTRAAELRNARFQSRSSAAAAATKRNKSADQITLRERMATYNYDSSSNNLMSEGEDDDVYQKDEDLSKLAVRHGLTPDKIASMKSRRKIPRRHLSKEKIRSLPSRSRTMNARVNGCPTTTTANAKPTTQTAKREVPSRTKSSGPTSNTMALPSISRVGTNSSGDSSNRPQSLRRNRTLDERAAVNNTLAASSDHGSTRKSHTTNKAPRRLPARSKSKLAALVAGVTVAEQPHQRKTPTRTKSGTMEGLKQAMKSLGATTTSNGIKTNNANTNSHSLNIFGSDLVSTDFILSQLHQLETDSNLVMLEMEDCLTTDRDGLLDEIPARLKEILIEDTRPWERIRFLDELYLAPADDDALETYQDFRHRRNGFFKVLGGVFAQKVIPVEKRLKVNLVDEDADGGGSGDAATITSSNMIELIEAFQLDPTITSLSIKSNQANVQLLRAVIKLLQCDDRVWESMNLQLSCTAPPVDDSNWQKTMQAATKRLQQVAKARGISLSH